MHLGSDGDHAGIAPVSPECQSGWLQKAPPCHGAHSLLHELPLHFDSDDKTAECKSPGSTGQAGSALGWRVQAGTVTVLASLCKSLSGAASSDGRHMATYSSYAIEYAVLCVQAMNLSRERGGGLPA